MRTDNALRIDAMNLLVKGLGELQAERFIYLVKRERFDYTEWQRDLWNDKTIEEVFAIAAEREELRHKQ
ncbi:MAG: hypothetical protein LBC71_03920 [Oscillospiraceae bacterium]|jgi:hypothetical protein|nr:hypothetical protein [Oscillospiraceae bacterium]